MKIIKKDKKQMIIIIQNLVVHRDIQIQNQIIVKKKN